MRKGNDPQSTENVQYNSQGIPEDIVSQLDGLVGFATNESLNKAMGSALYVRIQAEYQGILGHARDRGINDSDVKNYLESRGFDFSLLKGKDRDKRI